MQSFMGKGRLSILDNILILYCVRTLKNTTKSNFQIHCYLKQTLIDESKICLILCAENTCISIYIVLYENKIFETNRKCGLKNVILFLTISPNL